MAFDLGAASLTIEGVARAAGVSKGAVLYHFASKDQLLSAVLDSLFDGFDAAVLAEAANGGGWLRAYLRASFPEQRAGYLRETMAIFAIVSLRPELRPVAQERFLRWHRHAQEDGLDPVTASLGVRQLQQYVRWERIVDASHPGYLRAYNALVVCARESGNASYLENAWDLAEVSWTWVPTLAQPKERTRAEMEILLEGVDSPTMVRLTNLILCKAIDDGADLIRVDQESVHFLLDDKWQQVLTPPSHIHDLLLARFKVLSGIELSPYGVPRQGALSVRHKGDHRVLVQLGVTRRGERVSMVVLKDRSRR